MTNKQREIAKRIVELFRAKLDWFPDGRADLPLPSQETILDAIGGCLHSKNGTWRKSKPTSSKAATILWQLVKFHGGNGSLWGYPMLEDKKLVQELDTLALLIRLGNSPASDAWSKALYSK